MKRRKILIYTFFILILVIIEIFFFIKENHSDQDKFEVFTEKLWKYQLLADSLSMHYTVANPNYYNIEKYKVTLPNYSLEDEKSSTLKVENYISTLQKIEKNKLSKQDSFTYDLLLSYLETELDGLSFNYYSEPLSPSSGAQSQIPILLAEYTFRTKKDVEDYLELLECCDEYFESLATYEKEKSQAGLFMSDAAADKVIEQCDLIMNKTNLANGTHFLHTTFLERINGLVETGIITEEEKKLFIEENSQLLIKTLEPAYSSLADSIYVLKGSGGDSKGLCNYPQGKAYYSYLLKKPLVLTRHRKS